MSSTLSIKWSERAKTDVRNIYFHLLEKNSKTASQKIRDEIIAAPKSIIFPEQYQIDEYVVECRRMVVKNYKVLYLAEKNIITIISVFNTHQHPSKMRGIL